MHWGPAERRDWEQLADCEWTSCSMLSFLMAPTESVIRRDRRASELAKNCPGEKDARNDDV